MAIKETVFTLDLTREGRHPVVKFRLNDNKVQKITFRLTNNGQEVDLEREMGDRFKPVFECIFPDKTFKRDEDENNWEIKRDITGPYPLYTFTYYLTNEVVNKSGIACYYFALETPEKLRISTPTLKMVIDCDFKEDGKPSENYVSEFEKLLKEADRVKRTIEDLDQILKEVLAGGGSITEVILAREDVNGKIFDNLKDRLENDQRDVKNKFTSLENIIGELLITIKKFGGKDGAITNNAFSQGFNSNYDYIILPRGKWRLNDTITVSSGTPKKIIGTKGSVISIELPSSKTAFDFYNNIEFHGVTFDFNNMSVNRGLFYRENLGKVTLRDCKFKNVFDADKTTGSNIVYIANSGNSVDLNGIEFENILKRGNGNITDEAGSLNGIYIGNTNISGVLDGGVIRNVKVKDFHNVNDQGSIMYEDTAAIYVAGLSSAKMNIENVDGYNFGKRLIKTQVSNIFINNIRGESYTGDALSVVSTMDKEGVIVNNVEALGKISVAVNTSCENTIMNNIRFNIENAPLVGPNSFGIQIGASNATIRSVTGVAERAIVLFRNDGIRFRNIIIDSVNAVIPSYGNAVIQFLTNSEGFEGLNISNVFVENNSTFSSNFVSVFDTFYLNSKSKKSENLTLNNIVLNSKYTAAIDNERLANIYKVIGVNIRNITFTNGLSTRAYRGLYIEASEDIKVRDADIKAFVSSACQVKDCADVSIRGIKTHATSNYVATVFNSTKVKLGELEIPKVLLNDQLTTQNTTYEKRFSMGPSNLRPTTPYANDEHFDTTLGKQIWWDGKVWKDGTGTPVN